MTKYFCHDIDMHNNRKIAALEAKHGLVGYAICCKLLEVLAARDSHIIVFDDVEYEMYAAEFRCDADTLQMVISDAVRLRLFQADGDTIFCESLQERFGGYDIKAAQIRQDNEQIRKACEQKREEIKQVRSEAAKRRWSSTEPMSNDAIAQQLTDVQNEEQSDFAHENTVCNSTSEAKNAKLSKCHENAEIVCKRMQTMQNFIQTSANACKTYANVNIYKNKNKNKNININTLSNASTCACTREGEAPPGDEQGENLTDMCTDLVNDIGYLEQLAMNRKTSIDFIRNKLLEFHRYAWEIGERTYTNKRHIQGFFVNWLNRQNEKQKQNEQRANQFRTQSANAATKAEANSAAIAAWSARESMRQQEMGREEPDPF